MSSSDDELARIGTLGAYYAFSEDAMALGGSMGGSRALSLAALDVLENTGRELHRSRTSAEHARGLFARFAEVDRVRDRQLRRHAPKRQIPADESQRYLDNLDPPAWEAAPANAPALTKHCHELRTKALRDFTVEVLRVMIDQQVALNLLVGLALTRLRADPLLDSGRYPGDLLAALLQVKAAFWEPRLDPEVAVRKLAESLNERSDLEPQLRRLVQTFIREHPHRSASDFPD